MEMSDHGTPRNCREKTEKKQKELRGRYIPTTQTHTAGELEAAWIEIPGEQKEGSPYSERKRFS